MITQKDIQKYISKIPPTPKIVKKTLDYLSDGELTKAANCAKEDRALCIYLINLVNKPIYGFSNEVKDIVQIFSILGINESMQVIYNYMLNILSPKKWEFFNLNENLFHNLQSELSLSWTNILEHLQIDDREIQTSITLLPASVIVSEALFASHKEDVELIRSTKNIDLNKILKSLSGYSLFEICLLISKKWEMPASVGKIVLLSSGEKITEDDTKSLMLGKWMHLLLFFTLSKPAYIEANLNDFLEFNIEFVEDVYEEFLQVMEIES